MTNKVVREQFATWWEICSYQAELTPKKVVAFSPGFVTCLVNWCGEEPRERRQSRDNIFPSFEEARAEAIRRCQKNIDSLDERIMRARGQLRQWQSLKEPEAKQ